MVLDNASAQEAPFTESLPTSDLDPYANSDTAYAETRNVIRVTPPGSPPIHVNLDALPRRWSPLTTKPHHPMLQKGIVDSCRYAQEIMGRPVRQQEADALAFYFAKSIRVASYGTPVGVSVATFLAWRRQQEYRFPGWSPFKSGKLSADAFGPLKGQSARAIWRALSISAYWTVGGLLGSIGFAMYGLSSTAAARAFDPRLKDFQESLKQRLQSKQGARMPDQSDGPRKDETMEMARQRRAAQGAWRGKQGQGNTPDDMSPTGGAFQEDFVESGSDTGALDDGQIQQRDDQQRAASTPARPTASSQRTSTTTSPSEPAKQSGGAWDRIRQGAVSGSQAQPSSTRSRAQQSQSASSDDSFAFSQGEEDKQLAKSEAQKDFDARIERERAGKDFEERGGNNRRW